jgi:hypothetical protein
MFKKKFLAKALSRSVGFSPSPTHGQSVLEYSLVLFLAVSFFFTLAPSIRNYIFADNEEICRSQNKMTVACLITFSWSRFTDNQFQYFTLLRFGE